MHVIHAIPSPHLDPWQRDHDAKLLIREVLDKLSFRKT
jgi:hypothetical protein